MNTKNQNKNRQSKQGDSENRSRTRNTALPNSEYRSTNLRDSPMMAHLIGALEKGQEIGEYGRLTFVMVARFFLSDEEMLELLQKQPCVDEKDARAQITQVKNRGYNPPKRERILQWSERQEFQICPDPKDPNACNVYRELQFPDEIYAQIEDFWEEKAEAED